MIDWLIGGEVGALGGLGGAGSPMLRSHGSLAALMFLLARATWLRSLSLVNASKWALWGWRALDLAL